MIPTHYKKWLHTCINYKYKVSSQLFAALCASGQSVTEFSVVTLMLMSKSRLSHVRVHNNIFNAKLKYGHHKVVQNYDIIKLTIAMAISSDTFQSGVCITSP